MLTDYGQRWFGRKFEIWCTGTGGGCFGSPLSRIISDELGEITKKGHDAQDRQMILLMYKFREDISS